ncbi:Hypothetical predicted protein [Olea europaea subsp. europaea]|uniref:Uncharacterized protein n=1 Tax=Olea europaea subsp. europaea TaxID=158383 RepID=A0A8S0TRY1_OLEEU|nr:Hypothetical predicted protein [Olea europaea subsp. europaea]
MEISKHKTSSGERRRRSHLQQSKQSASLSQNTTELTQNQDLVSGPAFNIRRKPRMGSRVKRIGLECRKISTQQRCSWVEVVAAPLTAAPITHRNWRQSSDVVVTSLLV